MMAEENYSLVPRELEDYQEKYTVSDFAEYLETKLCWSSLGRKHHQFRWVFWSPKHDELEVPQTISFTSNQGYPTTIPATPSDHETIIRHKITCALQRIIECYIDDCLVQFWAPETRGGRCFLTTSGQPFAVDWLCKGFCWYRKHCSSHDYLVDREAHESELGPPGRVFQSGLPESSPDLRFYSTKEYPLRNQSLSCGIRAYMALPVFELLGQHCVGVLEFVVTSAGYINIVNEVEEGLKTADLRWTLNINQPWAQSSQLQDENDLQPYFGKTLRDAEKGLGVSRSTLKRACRGHNITRWPSNEKNKANPSLFLMSGADKSSHGCKGQFPMSDRPPPSDSDFMIVEADFEGDTIKFKLPFSSGMEKLEEEVARRLKLNVTSFRVKYLDEGGKWILLTCDDDLEFCVETLASSGCNLVKMSVQLYSSVVEHQH